VAAFDFDPISIATGKIHGIRALGNYSFHSSAAGLCEDDLAPAGYMVAIPNQS
jgi:hypothetical protein